jgi:hypothetical protein
MALLSAVNLTKIPAKPLPGFLFKKTDKVALALHLFG